MGRLGKAMDTSRQITQLIEAFLFDHTKELRPGRDPAVAAVVVETVIEAMGHKVVLERRNAPPAAVATQVAVPICAGAVASVVLPLPSWPLSLAPQQ